MIKNAAAIAAFACLVLGFSFAVWQASNHQHEKRAPREQYAHNDQTHSDKRAEKSATIQINCDPNCAADEPNNDGNPVYQFFHKFWSDPLTIVTLLLVAAVIVQVRDGRRSSERQLRAYVDIKTMLFYRPDTNDGDEREWPIHLVYRNAGQTPAYSVVVTAETFLGDGRPKDKIFTLSKAAETSPPAIVSPDARHTMTLGGIEPGHQTFLLAKKQNRYCYAWGRIDYIDTFGKKHFTKFQMWNGFQAAFQFGFCEVGNATDDEFPEPWWRRWKRVGHA